MDNQNTAQMAIDINRLPVLILVLMDNQNTIFAVAALAGLLRLNPCSNG